MKARSTKQKFVFVFCFALLLGCSLMLSMCMAFLHDSKTATGTIAFELGSPSLSFDNSIALYCTGKTNKSTTITQGSATSTGASLSELQSLTVKVNKNNSVLSSFYIKLVYDFSNDTDGTISFGNGTQQIGDSAQMSAMTQGDTKNEFYSVSNAKVPNGTTFDAYSFLRNMTYTSTTAITKTIPFKIIILADNTNTFDTEKCANAVIDGNIGLSVIEPLPLITLSESFKNITRFYYYIYQDVSPSKFQFYVEDTEVDATITINEDCYIKIDSICEVYETCLGSLYSITSSSCIDSGVESVKISSNLYKRTLISNNIVGKGNIIDLGKSMRDNSCGDLTYNGKIKFKISASTSNDMVEEDIVFILNCDFECMEDHWICCVSGDSDILTSMDGKTMLAKDIQVGDSVVAYDSETNSQLTTKVTDIIIRQRKDVDIVVLKDGTRLEITPEHPILTSDGWKCTNFEKSSYKNIMQENLKVGDKVKTENGYVEVAEIITRELDDYMQVYTFVLENGDCFIANGIIVRANGI